ncbi:hypothetical protein BGZ58_002871 [Dissophora ornata]|nr:hypothetical protein BGZ58_002871 [Dissophora ornata]
MSRAHSYAQIPVAEDATDAAATREDTLAFARSQKQKTTSNDRDTGRSKDHRGYSTLNDANDHEDDDDEFEDAGENSVMLRPIASSSSASSSSASKSAPRRPVYPSNNEDDDDDDDNEYDDKDGSSSSSSRNGAASAAAGSGSSASAVAAAKRNSGIRTTNISFLARLTGRQRPERDAKRIIQSTMDGVFSNLSAKPRVEKPYEEELPPSYKSASQDVSPAYYETNVLGPGFTDDDDMLLVEGLPVGGVFGLVWNMISFKMMNGELSDSDPSAIDPIEDSDTGYIGDTGTSAYYDPSTSAPSSATLRSLTEYMWFSYFMVILGGAIIVHSLVAFAKAKRTETIMMAASTAALEASIPASAAAGLSSSLAAFASIATSTSTLAAAATLAQPASSTAATNASGSGSRTVVIEMI